MAKALSALSAPHLPAPRASNIDALRAAACLMVIACHAIVLAGFEGYSYRVWLFGESGVVLFFVISGYLIGGRFLVALVEGDRLPDLKPYLLRRACRILPGWWLAFMVASCALLLLALPFPSKSVLLAHVTLVQLFIPPIRDGSPLGVGWTLCLEAAFYLLVPCIAGAVRAIRARPFGADVAVVWLLAIWILAGVCGELQDRVSPQMALPWDILEVRYLGLFVPGMLVYLLSTPVGAQSRIGRLLGFLVARPGLLVATLISALAAVIVCRNSSHTSLYAMSIPALSIAIGCLFSLAVRCLPPKFVLFRYLAPVGLISYGLYLYHSILGELLQHYGVTLHPGDVPIVSALLAWSVATGALFLVTVPLALASWTWLETPFMTWAASRSRGAISGGSLASHWARKSFMRGGR